MTSAAAGAFATGEGRHRRSCMGPARRLGRVAAAVATAGLAALVVLRELGFRGWEAWTAGQLTALVTAAPPFINHTTFYVDVDSPDVFGLRVTGECTAALIVIGLLGITAILTAATRLPLGRLAAATLVASALFYLINTARLVTIALASREWGLDRGFYWSHIWAGTFVTVVGVAGALALYLFTLGTIRTGPRKGRHTQ